MSKRQAQRKRKRYRDDDYTSEPDSTASEPEEDSDKPLPGTSRSTAPEDRRFGAPRECLIMSLALPTTAMDCICFGADLAAGLVA